MVRTPLARGLVGFRGVLSPLEVDVEVPAGRWRVKAGARVRISASAAGTYSDTIPNTAGCDSVSTINLTVNPAKV